MSPMIREFAAGLLIWAMLLVAFALLLAGASS